MAKHQNQKSRKRKYQSSSGTSSSRTPFDSIDITVRELDLLAYLIEEADTGDDVVGEDINGDEVVLYTKEEILELWIKIESAEKNLLWASNEQDAF